MKVLIIFNYVGSLNNINRAVIDMTQKEYNHFSIINNTFVDGYNSDDPQYSNILEIESLLNNEWKDKINNDLIDIKNCEKMINTGYIVVPTKK